MKFMKLIAGFAALMLAISMVHCARAESHTERLALQVADGDWGDAKPEEIEAVLQTVAAEIMRRFPGRRLAPIIVSPSHSGPIVLYQRGRQDEYQVHLAARGRRWAAYVYEFSHELFHILVNYQNHAPPHSARHQWFEESLCETMSLYTLKRLSASWEASPPRPEWASYASALAGYTRGVLNEPHRRLPPNTSFGQWFRDNGAQLAERPYLRDKNELVANLLLPLLEQESDWQAFGYFNLAVPPGTDSFHDFLAAWYRQTPTANRPIVARAMQIFQFDIPDAGSENLALPATLSPVPSPADKAATQLDAAEASRQ